MIFDIGLKKSFFFEQEHSYLFMHLFMQSLSKIAAKVCFIGKKTPGVGRWAGQSYSQFIS